ncbi:MAG TPA: hypothetical protein VEA16_21140, partial [Vicinamibacterales bacterium]|nr:hypothetical protein [Vicinamibacterales bacterium]
MTHTSRFVRAIAGAIVAVCLCRPAAAQSPNLTRQQRDLLQALIAAVDAAATQPDTPNLTWQSHILRASDGAHYVAFTAVPPADAALPPGPVMLYMRLATAAPAGTQRIVERSPLREWLAGSRIDPRLLPKRGIVIGEMPMMGAGGLNTVRPPTSTGSNELKLMALERERARQEQEDRDRQRRQELEGKAAVSRELLPFEDFDVAANSTRPDGQRIIARALTAGPGGYDLYVAWADPAAPKPAATVKVIRKSLSLEPARTVGLITSSVILADRVTVRATPYSPAEQASHPYSIGLMEITPARTNQYAREGNLSVAFQVINAQSNDAGMPDIVVNFRVVRVNGERESPVASLNPQVYNATTMPADFNLKLGHPIFAAVTAPLATLTRGSYRLKIQVNDRISNATASTDADFSIVGTPASLLAEAPPLGPAFRRDVILAPAILAGVLDVLAPAAPSPALARALTTARTGKLVDLLVEEPVPASEAGVRTALTGLAYFSIGDASAAVQLQRALQQNAPAAATQFLIGAARAQQARDADAIAAWQAAIAAGNAPPITGQLLADAYLRRNDSQRAADAVAHAGTAAATRVVASTHIANGREADAVRLLDAHLAQHPEDHDARWLLLHASYSQFIRDGAKPLPPAAAERF